MQAGDITNFSFDVLEQLFLSLNKIWMRELHIVSVDLYVHCLRVDDLSKSVYSGNRL